MNFGTSLQRTLSVSRKEMFHIFRDPGTLFFALFIPVLEMFLLGYAIDMNVRNVKTVVWNLDLNEQAQPTSRSRDLLQKFENSGTFQFTKFVNNREALIEEIVSGRAKVGIKIPANYSRQIESRGTTPAEVLVLIDGSNSTVAGTALNVANTIVLQESIDEAPTSTTPVIEARPTILFNPSMRSANFFVPGLVVVMCQMMAVMLSANAIVREKEHGTLEQLFMTPVRAGELIFGKLLPYLVLTMVEFSIILFLMWSVFQVPISGSVLTLFIVMLPFTFCFLGLGLWISTRVDTREAASQAAMGTVIPSIFLSGYVFPVDSMPPFFWYVAQVVPTTWMIDAARGVILRGATLKEIWVHAAVLWGIGVVAFTASVFSFRKRL